MCLGLVVCSSYGSHDKGTARAGSPTASPQVASSGTGDEGARGKAAYPTVIMVSVDVLNPSGDKRSWRRQAPTLFLLLERGASDLNARTEFESSVSLRTAPACSPAAPSRDRTPTTVRFNKTPDRTSPCNPTHTGRSPRSSTSSTTVGQAALYASKPKLALFARSWPTSIDTVVIAPNNDRLVSTLTKDMDSNPADISGHTNGFMSTDYLRAVEHVDDLPGRTSAAISASPRSVSGSVLGGSRLDLRERDSSHSLDRREAPPQTHEVGPTQATPGTHPPCVVVESSSGLISTERATHEPRKRDGDCGRVWKHCL